MRHLATLTNGPKMAAGTRKCRTAVDENGVPTFYIPMTRTELTKSQGGDDVFPVWWLVVRGSWWIWTPSRCIVVTRSGRTYHLDVDDGLPTLHNDDFQQLLHDTLHDVPHDGN